MDRTGIPHEDLLQLHFVSAIGGARIDSVTIVDAATHGIALNELDAHDCKPVIASVEGVLKLKVWVLSGGRRGCFFAVKNESLAHF